MGNKIYKLEERRKLIVCSKFIALSGKRFKDYEEMKSTAERISERDKFQLIKKKDLQQIKYDEIGTKIKMEFSSYKDPEDSLSITPKDKGELIELGELIGTKLKMSRIEKADKKNKYLIGQVLKIAFGIIASVFLVNLSISINNGETIEATGRQKLVKLLMFETVDILGPVGTAAVCAVIVGLLIYFTIKKYTTPSNTVIYQRNS